MFPTPIYCLKWKTLKWIVSLNLMQSSLSNFSVSILKINSKLKATLNTKSDRWWGKRCIPVVVLWCSGYHYCTISFNEAWNQVLGRFKSCLWHDRDSGWWGFLTMFPAGNKVKRLTPVNHTTKTIHHHNKCVLFIIFWPIQRRKMVCEGCVAYTTNKNGSFENSLPVSAITKMFLQFAIFLETISCLLFQSSSDCPPICSLFFGFPCHFAK